MKPLCAIATISMRSAIRSKLVLTLGLLLIVVAILLPGMLQGDGTLSGQVQLTVGYTLGITRFLLALTGIWAGCSAVSSDIAGRQLHLIVTKPVRPVTIWLGKWLGLIALLGVLLVVSSSTIYLVMQHSMKRMAKTPREEQILREEILVARRAIKPNIEELRLRAEALCDEKAVLGQMPADLSREQAVEGLTEALQMEKNSIAPHGTATWLFMTPAHLSDTPSIQLRYSIAAADVQATTIEGQWTFGRDPVTGQALQTNVIVPRGKIFSTRIPATALSRERNFLAVQFLNNSSGSNSIIFPPSSGPELLYYAGSFTTNYLRAMLVIFIQLAFWTAIGVTAGCIFSMPVAAFATCWFVLLANISTYLSSVSTEYSFSGGDSEHQILNMIFGPLYWMLSQMVRPLQSEPVLAMLTQGERINWSVPGHELLIKVVIYCGILAWIGQHSIKHREIGLPVKSQ